MTKRQSTCVVSERQTGVTSSLQV